MLLKLSQLWECKGNEEMSLYDYSNESIEITVYIIRMMRWEIIYWDMMSSYYKPPSMTYELNEMELYTEHL